MKALGPQASRNKLGTTKGKPSAKTARDGLDRMFSALVRNVGVCEICGATSDHQCAHGFSRRYLSVRWDRRNAFCLCRGCHMKYTHRPLEWDEWLRARWGEDLYWEMRHLALQTGVKVDYEALRVALVAEIQAHGITMNKMPKAVIGWTGITNPKDYE